LVVKMRAQIEHGKPELASVLLQVLATSLLHKQRERHLTRDVVRCEKYFTRYRSAAVDEAQTARPAVDVCYFNRGFAESG
jgi:hypothetical protein